MIKLPLVFAITSCIADFSLNSKWTGLIVAIINIGSIAAVPLSGPVLDKYGRRKGMMIGSVIGLVGSILQASAHGKAQLLIGRFLIGASFIFTAAGSAPWLMEIAAPKQRQIITNSMLGGLPLVGFLGSIVFLYIWDYNSEWSWRGGLLGEMLGPLVSLIALIFSPESIRYLVSKGRNDEAFNLLVKIRGVSADDLEVLEEFSQITNTLKHEQEIQPENKWVPLTKPVSNFRRFMIAILTQVFFQTNGSNFMQAFFSLILVSAGVTDMKLILKVSVGYNAWAACATIVGIFLIQRLGARWMLLWSTPVLSFGFALLAILQSQAEATGKTGFSMGAVAVCFLFQAVSFSSWILLAFSFPSEILTYGQRARGIALSQAIGYLFAALMAFTIPLAVEHIPWKFFVICAIWVAAMFPIIWWLFPETQGRSLEEVDALFEGRAEEWLGVTIDGEPQSCDEKDVSKDSKVKGSATKLAEVSRM